MLESISDKMAAVAEEISSFVKSLVEMPVQVTEDEKRELAYRLWEEAGCPEGRGDEFWLKAELILGGEVGPKDDPELKKLFRKWQNWANH